MKKVKDNNQLINSNDLDNLKNEIDKYNRDIFDNEEQRKQNKEKPFKIISGIVPIIFSAPHCVEQLREGKIKRLEGETGAIVQILAKRTNCYAIYKTYNNNDDANYDIEGNTYKSELVDIIKKNNIKLLLDIHGAKNEHNFNIEICTDYGKNVENKDIIDSLKDCFKKNEIPKITENTVFKADSIRTISKYIHTETNIPCVQLEITGRYRYIENLEGIRKLINSLSDFVDDIKEKI